METRSGRAGGKRRRFVSGSRGGEAGANFRAGFGHSSTTGQMLRAQTENGTGLASVSELPSHTRRSWEKNLGSTVLAPQSLRGTQRWLISRALVRETKHAGRKP